MTSKSSSLKRNFIMNAILTMSTFIFPLITFPYVSRILTAEGMGKVQFATSLISYFTLFSQLGVPTYGIRICARVRDDSKELSKTVQELFILRIFTTIISYIALFILIFTVPRLENEQTLYIIISMNIFFTFIGMEWLYKALEQYTYITIRSIVFKVIALISMFLLVHKKQDYLIYGGISILAGSASNIFNFINVHKYISLKPLGNYDIKKHLKPVLMFFAMSCAITVYTNLDTIMLGFMSTNVDVGYYSVAVKVKNILVSIITSLSTVLLPRVSYYIKHGEMEMFYHITEKSLKFVILVSLPLSIYFMTFAKYGIYFLSGSGYEGAIKPMFIIMPTLLLIGLTNIMGIQILVPMGREKITLYSVVAGAVIDVLINFILIPPLKSSGAAIGTLIAEIVVFIVEYIFLRDIILPVFKKINWKLIIITLIFSTLVSICTLKLELSDFMTLIVSSLSFFGSYIFILILKKEPLVIEMKSQILNKVLKKKIKK